MLHFLWGEWAISLYASSFKHRRIQASKEATSYADSVGTLRKANKDNYAHVLEICRTRVQLSSTSIIIVKIIDAIADGNKIHNMMGTNVTNLREGRQKQTIVGGAKSLSNAVPCLSKIGSMGGNSIYNIVGLRARKLLYKQNLEIFTEIITKGHCGFLFPFHQSKKEVRDKLD